jgi:hypothetical protein
MAKVSLSFAIGATPKRTTFHIPNHLTSTPEHSEITLRKPETARIIVKKGETWPLDILSQTQKFR